MMAVSSHGWFLWICLVQTVCCTTEHRLSILQTSDSPKHNGVTVGPESVSGSSENTRTDNLPINTETNMKKKKISVVDSIHIMHPQSTPTAHGLLLLTGTSHKTVRIAPGLSLSEKVVTIDGNSKTVLQTKTAKFHGLLRQLTEAVTFTTKSFQTSATHHAPGSTSSDSLHLTSEPSSLMEHEQETAVSDLLHLTSEPSLLMEREHDTAVSDLLHLTSEPSSVTKREHETSVSMQLTTEHASAMEEQRESHSSDSLHLESQNISVSQKENGDTLSAAPYPDNEERENAPPETGLLPVPEEVLSPSSVDNLRAMVMKGIPTVTPAKDSLKKTMVLYDHGPSTTQSSLTPEQSVTSPDNLLLKTSIKKTTSTVPTGRGKQTTHWQKPRSKVRCDRYCSCHADVVSCTGTREPTLNYIPQVPAMTRRFMIRYFHLPNLTYNMLANLTNFDITTLNLFSNNIRYLTHTTFALFRHLEVLDLSGNPISASYLDTGLSSISSNSMNKLYLQKMGLNFLPDNVFDIFTNKSLEKVNLAGNNLKSFDSTVFSPFRKVSTVDYSRNVLTQVNISSKVNIKRLVLTDNVLLQFPDLCLRLSPHTESNAFGNLRSLYIGGNIFERIPADRLRGVCFPHLNRLDISSTKYVYKLEDNFIADLPRLEELFMTNMKVKYYKSFAFNSSSLQRLQLRQSRRIRTGRINVYEMFRHCPNLKTLAISNTNLDLSDEEMFRLLAPLTSLTHLTLERMGIGFFPADLLWRFSKLEKLIMPDNNLSAEMLGQALKGVTSVKYLNVRANDINVLDERTLPLPFRQHVKKLDLAHNPFSCTCDLRWFKRWLDQVTKNGQVEVNGYPSKHHLQCDTPPEKRRLPLMDFHLSDEECEEKFLGVTLGIMGLCMLVVVTAASSMAYRYRLYLRSFIYRLRRRRRDGKEGRPPNTEFDMYIACSPTDTDWVCLTLLPFLEEEHGLSIFLRQRDAPIGAFVAKNITEFIDKSGRILLLISDLYVSEAWCQYEFQHIIYTAIDQHKDVIVVLKDVTTNHLTIDMIRMLTRGTYLQWGSSQEAQRLFREGLAVALRTVDNMYDSLC